MTDQPDDFDGWLRVHGLSLTQVGGQAQRELLLTLAVYPPRVDGSSPPNPQDTARQIPVVLGPHAASILLRLLLNEGVQPAPAEDAKTSASDRH